MSDPRLAYVQIRTALDGQCPIVWTCSLGFRSHSAPAWAMACDEIFSAALAGLADSDLDCAPYSSLPRE